MISFGKLLMVGMAVILLVGLIDLAIAERSTQQYSKIYMNPLYNIEMDKNQWYDYTLVVDTPDGISEVANAMVTMQLWLSPTVVFDLEVNGLSCNNPQYQVHTTFANAGEGTIFFDCSNIITGEGNYSVRIKTSKDTGASTFWVDLTYENNPEGNLHVEGTEYYPGFNATSFLQLVDNNGNFVDNASCDITIWNPPHINSSKLYEGIPMTFVEVGIYEFNFVAPGDYGVYKVAAFCEYENEEQVYELPSTTDFDGNLFDESTGDPAEVEFSDCVFMKTDSSDWQQFDFIDAGIGNINTSNLDEIVLVWIGQNDKEIDLQIRNFNTASWDTLGSSTDESSGTSGDCQKSHGVSRAVTSGFADYIGGAGSNEIWVRSDTGQGGKILTDNIELRIRTDGTAVNDIRGAGEIVIKPKVWNDDYTALVNRTVSTDLSNQTINVNTTEIADAVWSFTNRTLTAFDFSIAVNATEIAEAVWSFTTRTLTAFVFPVVIDYELNSDYVWNSTTRDLTDFEFEVNATVNETAISNEVWNETGRYTHGIIIP